MTIRWSETAGNDLDSIYDHILRGNEPAAAKTIGRIVTGVEMLAQHPALGRRGEEPGTRELIVPPYRVIYRINAPVIEIAAVIHGAPRYPN
jgi:toxin ParE1/3/4